MKISNILLIILALGAFASCKNDTSNKELAAAEVVLLSDYIEKTGVEALPNVSHNYDSLGIYYISRKVGPGIRALAGDVVSVRVEAFLLDSTLYYSNLNDTRPYSFTLIDNMSLNQTSPANVSGFHNGVSLMNEGGKATFIIPSDKAYGSRQYSDPRFYGTVLPKYTPLRFEVELTDISRSTRD